ncbi:MAG: hypothetical protein AAF968_26080, partial [Pseudomonadota bacterium]
WALAVCLAPFVIHHYYTPAPPPRAARAPLARTLEQRIARFEPRLEELAVTALPPRDPSERILRLRIAARFSPQPGLPSLVFQTKLDPTTQRFSVRDGDDG